jgi:threonine dehydrogenase-like Zn-dependent dehydrogenase
VAVERAGVCGSDLHVYHARERGLDRGTVMGHEFVGRVLEAGPEVTGLGPGDRVFAPFTTSCGACWFCARGLTARCPRGELFGWVQDGAGLHGGQAERVRVPLAAATLLPVPDDLDPEVALLLGDVLSTGAYCAERAEVGPDDVVAVLGCGPVGVMSLVGARERGVTDLYAVDAVPERLELAARFGAVPLPLADDPVAAVRRVTGGRGADAVLEAVGSPAAGRLAFDMVRPGGVISTAGVHTEPHMAFSPVEAYDKNVTYRSGRCPARAMMERLLPLARAGRYPVTDIVSHRLPLADGVAAYRMFAAREDGCTKVILVP